MPNNHQRFTGIGMGGVGLWRTLRGGPTIDIDLIYQEELGRMPTDEERGDALWKLGWRRLYGATTDVYASLEELRLDLRPGSPQPQPQPPPRPGGRVRLDGRACADDRGPFLALGATLFPAIWAARTPTFLRRNLEWLRDGGVDYVRILGMVGAQPYWRDRVVDPDATWYVDARSRLFDLLGEYGLRAEVTLFADAQVMMPGPSRRRAYVDDWLRFIDDRPEQVMHLEVANEWWQNGIDLPELRETARRLKRGTQYIIAASAPRGEEVADYREVYDGDVVDLMTPHFSRRNGEEGWRFTRQAWEARSSVELPFANNEPTGVGSSVTSVRDAHKLVSDLINTHISGGAGYVYHSHAGVRMDQDLSAEEGANEARDAFQAVRALLPPDLANWHRQNHHWTGHPFRADFRVEGDKSWQIWPDGWSHHGCVRAFAATKGDRYVMLLTGIKDRVQLTGGSYTVYDPVMGHEVDGGTIRATNQSRLVVSR